MDSVAPPKNKLLEGPIFRSLLALAVPIVAANTLQSAYQIIDAFWVGRLGGAAVAAVSLSFPVMFLMFATTMTALLVYVGYFGPHAYIEVAAFLQGLTPVSREGERR